MIVGVLIGVAAFALVIGLVIYLSREAAPRTAVWASLLIAATVVALLVMNLSSIYYHTPLVWWLARGLALAAVVATFWATGNAFKWKPPLRVAALAGLVLASIVLLTIVLMALPVGGWFVPIFEARAQQIAADNGFTAEFATAAKMQIDSLPVGTTPDGKGVAIEYEGFLIQERKAETELSYVDLKTIEAAGTDPLGLGGRIPSDAVYTELEVGKSPALGVEYANAGPSLPGKEATVRILAFEKEGLDVRIWSQSYMRYTGANEQYEFTDALSFDRMIATGESLEPLK